MTPLVGYKISAAHIADVHFWYSWCNSNIGQLGIPKLMHVLVITVGGSLLHLVNDRCLLVCRSAYCRPPVADEYNCVMVNSCLFSERKTKIAEVNLIA